ncbi:MAG: NAD(P)-binding domain-containing protein, partial [Cyanobacteria bacterium J06636_28]
MTPEPQPSTNGIDPVSSPIEQLEQLILTRQATVGVVGLGYVGLPFAIEKTKVGFNVIGIEQNPRRAERVNQADSYIDDVDSDILKQAVTQNKLKAVTSFDNVVDMDVIVICVPTPLTKNLTPDLSYVESVAHHIGAHLRPGQLISLESTTYPGTTDDVIRPILEN